MDYQEGDIIGVTSRLGNAVVNFIKLWWVRDYQYAKKNWKALRLPVRFYIVVQGRMNGLLYALNPIKKKGKPDIQFKSLSRVGKIVYVGRAKCYDSLVNQMKLAAGVNGLHYELTTGRGEYSWFKKKRVLRNRFLIDVIGSDGIKFDLGYLNENLDCDNLYVIESNNFARVYGL